MGVAERSGVGVAEKSGEGQTGLGGRGVNGVGIPIYSVCGFTSIHHHAIEFRTELYI